MRFVRRASLVFSLVLIVAIAVGYVARTAGIEHDRDRTLTAAAELGAARLTAIVDATSLAARAATEAPITAEALASLHPELGVCVVGPETASCVGAGPTPSDDAVEESSRLRKALDAELAELGPTSVSVYDSLMTIEAIGPNLTVLVSAPADVMRRESGSQTVWATTLLPDGVNETAFVVDQGIRQTSAAVASAPGVYVVAAVADRVNLPVDEYRFYVLIFCLAVVLLVLAGVTIFFEQQKLLERASFDPLTKLPNRGEFERRAANIIDESRSDEGACLLLFDLDGFKQVNDTYGHRAGDEMLKVVGSRLRKAVRDNDVVARWGGDEFVVVMPGISTEEMGGRRALELAEQIGGRTRLDGLDDALRVKVSVGVAVWPTHGVNLDDLVVAADQAMYEAKRDGATSRMATSLPEPTAPLVSTSA